MEKFNIQGVEIFSVGEWNGDPYSLEDLNLMVNAFEETKSGIRPYLKLGHDDKQKILQADGLPSAGWIENIYIFGDKLLADFTDIPKKVYDLIKAKAYRKVSSEIFWNLKIKDKVYKRALGAVALLGADTPGVMNLSDILAMYKNNGHEALKFYEKEFDFKQDSKESPRKVGNMPEKTESEIKLELQLQAAKDSAEAKEVEAKKFALDIEAKDKELIELRKDKAASDADKAKLQAEAEVARIEKFVTELVSEKLCSPAMKDKVTQLLGPDKKEYTVKIEEKDKEINKQELIKETLKLAKHLSEVNFEENSEGNEKKTYKADDEMDKKAKEYMKENDCTYGQAVKAIIKKNK